MVKKITFLFAILFYTASFSQQKKSYVQSDKSQYAILKFKNSYYEIFKNAKATTLSEKEIELTENLLKSAIKEHNRNIKNALFTIKEFKNYKRQLIPIINEKGEKEVWVNCFCDKPDKLWRKEIILVFDGGNCYFNLKINLTKKTFYQISVNGYA
jgi:hypothetical protein